MKLQIKTGLMFGLTSGVITTLGLIIGLNSSTGSRLAVIGGILTIAIADALSDALGIHLSKESENKLFPKELWGATIATFFFKFIFATSFIFPVLIFNLPIAIIINIIWGILLIIIASLFIAKNNNKRPLKVISGHLLLTIFVIFVSYFVGKLVNTYFS